MNKPVPDWDYWGIIRNQSTGLYWKHVLCSYLAHNNVHAFLATRVFPESQSNVFLLYLMQCFSSTVLSGTICNTVSWLRILLRLIIHTPRLFIFDTVLICIYTIFYLGTVKFCVCVVSPDNVVTYTRDGPIQETIQESCKSMTDAGF